MGIVRKQNIMVPANPAAASSGGDKDVCGYCMLEKPLTTYTVDDGVNSMERGVCVSCKQILETNHFVLTPI